MITHVTDTVYSRLYVRRLSVHDRMLLLTYSRWDAKRFSAEWRNKILSTAVGIFRPYSCIFGCVCIMYKINYRLIFCLWLNKVYVSH